MFLRRVALSLVAAASFATTAVHAIPTLHLQLSSGGANSGIITDSAHTGKVKFDDVLGGFSINFSGGIGVGSLNSSGGNLIDLVSANTAGDEGGVVTIMLSQTGLTGTAGLTAFQSVIAATLNPSFTSNAASTITFSTYTDTNDNAFALSNLVYTNTFTGRGIPVGANAVTNALTSAKYSETIVVTINSAPNATTSFDAYVSPVPLPATLALLGLGMFGLGLLGKSRKSA